MTVMQSGSVSIITVVGLYWLIVVAIYMVRGRLEARKAQPGPDGRVVLAGELNLLRAATVLLGPPVAVVLMLWLITVL